MPVSKCPNRKWKIGSGGCMYDSKEKAEKAYKGYLASKREELKYGIISELEDLKLMGLELSKLKKVLYKYGSNK